MREQSDQRRVVSEVRVDVRHRRGLAPRILKAFSPVLTSSWRFLDKLEL